MLRYNCWCVRLLVSLLGFASLARVIPAAAGKAPPATTPQVVSSASTYSPNCAGTPGGNNQVYINGVVEPSLAVDPLNSQHLIGAWQQDRWSNLAASGIQAAVSWDAGQTWTSTAAPFSRCTGGNAANGGNYLRASDPWLTFAPNGDVYQSALTLLPSRPPATPVFAVLVSKSVDGGLTWSEPATLIRDADGPFNDKETITADPNDARFVYAVWDRVDKSTRSSWFARTTDAGTTWEVARPIFDPGPGYLTIGNQITVLPSGDLVDALVVVHARVGGVLMPCGPIGTATAHDCQLVVIRSSDRGLTWSDPTSVARVSGIDVGGPEAEQRLRPYAQLVDVTVDARTGTLYLAWGESRFSDGMRDDIALAWSDDGGITWSEPAAVTAVPQGVSVYVPSIAVQSDSSVGLAYYAVDTDSAVSVEARYVLLSCPPEPTGPDQCDEMEIAGPFDLNAAPVVGDAHMVGDYQGLVTADGAFLLLFAVPNADTPERATDVVFFRAGPVQSP